MFNMSLVSGYVGAKYSQEFGLIFFALPSANGYMGAKYFQEFVPRSFGMSSASGYMGATYFQEFGPRFLTCPLSLRGGGHFHKTIPSRNKRDIPICLSVCLRKLKFVSITHMVWNPKLSCLSASLGGMRFQVHRCHVGDVQGNPAPPSFM